MKKRLIAITLIMITSTFIFACGTGKDADASLYQMEIKKLYESGQADQFALINVDNEGAPELVAVSSEGAWDKDQIFFYTIHDKTAVLLTTDVAPGIEGHYLGLYEGENVVECSGAALGDRRDYYSINAGKLDHFFNLQSYTDPTSENGDDLYFVDEQETDEAQYKKAEADFVAAHNTMIKLDADHMTKIKIKHVDGYIEYNTEASISYLSYDEIMKKINA